MNRLSNYFKATKMARSWLHCAKTEEQRGKREKALRYTILAMDEMVVAMNNVASIAFNKKPKK